MVIDGEGGEMKATKRYMLRHFSIFCGTAEAKIVVSYLAAYLTAFAVIGIFYLSGFFGVGFFSKEIIRSKIFTYVLSLIH